VGRVINASKKSFGGGGVLAHNLALKWEGEVILFFDFQEKTVFCQQE